MTFVCVEFESMGYAADHYQPSVLELARSGNYRAISYWLNVFLLPHNLFAQVRSTGQSGCVQVLVEFHPSPDVDAKSSEFRKSLVHFICHHVWKLNSAVIEGVQVVARFVGTPQILWKQTVRVVSPARRDALNLDQAQVSEVRSLKSLVESAQLTTRIQHITFPSVPFRVVRSLGLGSAKPFGAWQSRSLLLTGTTAAAFFMGCWFGYSDAPPHQTNAAAVTKANRSKIILTATESIPVEAAATRSTDGTATLMFGGDVALTDAYSDLVGTDHTKAFSAFEEGQQADVMMVNLDAPFTSSTTPNPKQSEPFKVDPAKVEVLKNGGIDLVNLANQRVMDYQAAGLEDTLKTLDQAGIRYVGSGLDDKEARRPRILDVDGQRIAYFGYTESDLQATDTNQPGPNLLDRERITADIQSLREQVDWVVVNFHWGKALAKSPNDWQIGLAHHTIDQGADLVVGYHSNILQGAELYKGRPIVYSLGNFIFGGKSQGNYDTAMLRVALKDNQMKVELLPVEVRDFQPKIVSGDRGKEILQTVEAVSNGFQQPLKSPVVLDAKLNTVVSHPDPTSSEVKPASESPTSHSQPSPSSGTPESPASESPETFPSPAEHPSESPGSPDSQNQPNSPTPSPSATSSSVQPSEQPWNENSFIGNPNASPSPMVSPQEGATRPGSPSGSAELDRGNVTIEPIEPIEPIGGSPLSTSLEPMKRRYAETVPATLQAFLNP
jgi:poly-gamma-glutamate capsule biosynthesis protein CapA/YwtB (metallophosphatase superfamily)